MMTFPSGLTISQTVTILYALGGEFDLLGKTPFMCLQYLQDLDDVNAP